MARTSKRYIEKKSEKTERKVFKAGIYTRLSNERTEEWREKSYSIETQILSCKEYALKENIDVLEFTLTMNIVEQTLKDHHFRI